MSIFINKNGRLEPVREAKVKLEKDIQGLTEKNIETVFGLKFVSSEFSLNGLRIDTLAFDQESKAFVIIEFKRDKSFSVVDQGFAYLALMLNNKADFILEYNERLDGSLKREDVDWSQSRVLFLAHSFTEHQRQAINFKDLPIELWEVRMHDGGMISYNAIKAIQTAESIKTVSKDVTVAKVSKEVRKYTLDDLVAADDKVRSLYEEYRERLYAIDDRLEEKFNKHYVSFSLDGRNVTEVQFQKSRLRVHLDEDIGKLSDPEKRLNDCSKVGHLATGNTWTEIKTEDDMVAVLGFVRQVLSLREAR
jgi:predicted transport protein